MTRFYLDTEFNSFGGKLISMALISPQGHKWYECIESADPYNEWVAEHVIPYLGKAPVTREQFMNGFREFISFFDRPEIICDWQTDIVHFCQCLDGDSFQESVPFDGTFKVIQTPPGEPKPKIPHNALSDAEALMDWHLREG